MTANKTTLFVQRAVAAAVVAGAEHVALAQTAPVVPTARTPDSAAQASASLNAADRKFAVEAAKGNLSEVALGQLAQSNASSDAVKKFGSRMASDHGKANDRLKQIASAKGAELPVQAPKDAQERHLESLRGAAFDREYMSHMVKDHHQDIAAFKKEADSGKDPELKAFASETLPTLESHLQMAEQTSALMSSVGGNSAMRQ